MDDVPVEKPGTPVRDEASVRVRGEDRRFVSRGGEKLAGALEDLGIEVRSRVCLDIGASTGGFTDCLLQAGAAQVLAVDVGYGQLHPRLRGDRRVLVRERVNARHLEPAHLAGCSGPIGLCVVDVSFISSTLLLPRIVALAPEAEVLVMVKPQFEVGREQVGKGGVVRDDALRREAVTRVAAAASRLGLVEQGQVDSRLAGPKGNREIFLQLRPTPVGTQ